MQLKRSVTTLIGVVVVATSATLAACSGEAKVADPTRVPVATGAPLGTSLRATDAPTTTLPPTTTVPPYQRAGWIAEENKKPGTDAWRIDVNKIPKNTFIEGYFNTVSAKIGDTLDLAVSTNAPTWTVTGYRMGFYGGTSGRVVFESPPQPGVQQPAAIVDKNLGLAEARWPSSLKIAITKDFPPGDYLFKLIGSNGAEILVPLTIRNDDSRATVAVINAVTTWQAYNDWGLCSYYKCQPSAGRSRANVVSFDRPYLFGYNQGTADFIDHELALVSLVEELGLEVDYVTDLDIHQKPESLKKYKVAISLGHDEYYSRAMYDSLVNARDAGVNLMFLGANAVYRGIRFEPGFNGVVDRRMVNYRSTADPITKTDPQSSTVEWRVSPLNRPENALIGVMYACAGVVAPMRITNASNWVFEGTGAKNGMTLPNVIGNEYDRVYPGSPPTLELLARSPLTCRDSSGAADMTYYTAPSGAGVFATGTIRWICSIDAMCTTPDAAKIVRGVTINVLNAFNAGPAAAKFPSKPNLSSAPAAPSGSATTTRPATTAAPTASTTANSTGAPTTATTAPATTAVTSTTAKPAATTVIAPTTTT